MGHETKVLIPAVSQQQPRSAEVRAFERLRQEAASKESAKGQNQRRSLQPQRGKPCQLLFMVHNNHLFHRVYAQTCTNVHVYTHSRWLTNTHTHTHTVPNVNVFLVRSGSRLLALLSSILHSSCRHHRPPRTTPPPLFPPPRQTRRKYSSGAGLTHSPDSRQCFSTAGYDFSCGRRWGLPPENCISCGDWFKKTKHNIKPRLNFGGDERQGVERLGTYSSAVCSDADGVGSD